MVSVPFPALSSPNKFSETGGRLINAYLEKLEDGRIARRRVPGLRSAFQDLTGGKCRGFLAIANALLVAIDQKLYKIESISGTYQVTDLGTLTGLDQVYFARNNKSPSPDIVAVTNATAYVIDLATGASSYPDPDVASPNSVISQGGYFIFTYGEGRMRHTDINSTAINTLDTAFAETRPDGLRRVVNYGADILAMGESSIEIWRNTGNSPGFVYSYVSTIEQGLLVAAAVSGHESGFSDYGPRWLGDDGIVYRLNGYQKERISTHALERLIQSVADKTKFEAMSYIHGGHPCWALSCDEWTWEHDIATGVWYERQSHKATRWRASQSVRAFGQWIVGDYKTPDLYLVDPLFNGEGSDPLTVKIRSSTMSPFPVSARWLSLELDIMAGTGITPSQTTTQSSPQAWVSWSFDGGVSFGNPILREIGKQGQYGKEIRINNLGLVTDRGAAVEVAISDPVPFTLFGGNAEFKKLTA